MTPEIKHRIEQIQRGEIPAGYQKTAIGIIPIDWKVVTVGECISEYRCLSNDVKSIPVYSSSRKGLIPQSEYYDKKVALETNLGYKIVPEGYVTYRHMSDDDIFHFNINMTGGEILVSSEYPVFTSSEKGDLGFIIPILNNTEHFRYFCRTQKLGGTRTRLYFKNLSKYRFSAPKVEEQKNIAQVLSTQEKIIDLKEKLLAEKQKQKKYLMQQLFKGKYQENSKKVKLGDISSTFSGGTPDRTHPEYFGGGINWIKSGELNQKNIIRTEETITLEGLVNSSAKMVPRNTLLIAMYGATAGVMAVTKIDAAINQAVLAIIPQIKLNACYLKYAIEIQIDSAVNRLTQGGQPNFNAKIIKSFMIALPQLENQNVIAEILSTADREIELLERDLEQEKQKKKALMQLLLTGIVRISM